MKISSHLPIPLSERVEAGDVVLVAPYATPLPAPFLPASCCGVRLAVPCMAPLLSRGWGWLTVLTWLTRCSA